MAIAYPLDLRTIIKQGKARSQPAQFSMSDSARGPGYVQPTGSDVPVNWSITFKFTQKEAQRFWLWFSSASYLDKGRNTFILPIKTEFGTVEHECQFLPDGLMSCSEDGSTFVYTATITARALIIPEDFTDIETFIVENVMMEDSDRALFDEALNLKWPAA